MIRKTSYWILGVAFALLLAQAAGADWNITDVRVTADGSRETIHVLFASAPEQGAVPSFTDQAFREAGYGCLEIRNASVSGGDRAIAHDGSFVKSVRILNDKDTCRVLFHLNRWSPYAIEQDGGEIRVIFSGETRRGGMADAPALFAMNTGAGQSTLVLTNDPLDAFMSGAEKGEAVVLAQTTDKPLTISSKEPPSFYTPPSADQRATVAARAEEDIFARLVTLRFKDADLQNIIRLIAQQTGLNVIMAKSQVSGTITVNLEDVPLGSALDAILKTHGLAFVREPGGIVRIVPRSEIQAAKIETKTVHIPVNWVPATTLANTLRPFLSTAEGAQIQADSESNALIIIDTPPNVETLIALAEKLDVPEKQVMIEMRLVDIGKNLLRELGSKVSASRVTSPRNTRILEDVHEQVPVYKDIFEQLPLYREIIDPITGNVTGREITGYANGQVIGQEVTGYTDGKVIDQNLVDKKVIPYLDDAGIQNFTGDGTPQLDSLVSNAALAYKGGTAWQWGKVVSILGSDFNLDVFFTAYETKNLVKVLANPRVITLNNVEAKIDIIEEYPYTDTVIGTGGAQTIKAEFKETGITMAVTPYITNNGYVRMKIKPEQKIYRGRYANTPIVDKRAAETNVIVRDEETVLLGGLRQTIDTKSSAGTPWFMDIPVIGWLFKSNSRDDSQLEMVMFVTPHIINEPELTQYEKLQYDHIDHNWTLPEEFFKSMNDDKPKENK